jgi:hypothetical protein
MYTREVKFFNLVAPRLTAVRLPKVWYAAASTEPPQGLLAMEDLNQKGYTFGQAAEPWSVKRVISGVEQLAALHAGQYTFILSQVAACNISIVTKLVEPRFSISKKL